MEKADRPNKISGFTLIELIVVIVILGILSAVAVPRFISQTSSARKAAILGLAGNLNSAVALAQAEYIAEGNSATSGVTTITMNGVVVNVVAGSGMPVAASLGTSAGAMSNLSGFTVVPVGLGADIRFSPSAIANCYVYYLDTNIGTPGVYPTTSGC